MAILDHGDGTRTCSNCDIRQPLDRYDLDKRAATGRRGECKSCRSTKMKAWYAANQERQMLRARDRFARNIDNIRQQDLERYERHREKRIALATDVYHARRDKLRAPGQMKGITDVALRRRHGDQCCYCGITMNFQRIKGTQYNPDRATIEHITPISEGGAHDWDNVTRLGARARGALSQAVIQQLGNHPEPS